MDSATFQTFTQASENLGLTVEYNHYSSSYMPATGVWLAQHQTVSEKNISPCANNLPQKFIADLSISKTESLAGEAIIRHQLGKNIGHYSVMNFAFVSFSLHGFDHNTLMQLVRHHESHFLVQSMRYTGDRIINAVKAWHDDHNLESLHLAEKLFYVRPVGFEYSDRTGKKSLFTEDKRNARLQSMWNSAVAFADAVEDGDTYEMARGLLAANFRQAMYYAGTYKDFWHLLDQRTKADAQLESRVAAELMLQALEQHSPVFAGWYRTNRYGKAILTP